MLRACAGAIGLFATTASALDFRSIADAPSILYGGPSLKTEKLYVVSAASPVEVISAIEGWVKVRTAVKSPGPKARPWCRGAWSRSWCRSP